MKDIYWNIRGGSAFQDPINIHSSCLLVHANFLLILEDEITAAQYPDIGYTHGDSKITEPGIALLGTGGKRIRSLATFSPTHHIQGQPGIQRPSLKAECVLIQRS